MKNPLLVVLTLLCSFATCFAGPTVEEIPVSQGSGLRPVDVRVISTDGPFKHRPALPRFMLPANPARSAADKVRDNTEQIPVADYDESEYVGPETAGTIHRSWQTFQSIGVTPADPSIGAGPSEVVVAINREFSIYNKKGDLLDTFNINTFLDDNASIFDPKVMYDVFDNRWLIVWIRRVTGNTVATSDSDWILMISDNSTAVGNWYVYRLDAQVVGSTPELGTWVDYPYVGVDADAVCLSGDMIGWFGGTGGRSRMRFLRKSQIYAGASSINWWDWIDLQTNSLFDRRLCLSTHTFAGGAMYCVNSLRGGGDEIIVRRLTNTTFPTNAGPTSTKDVETVGSYSAPSDLAQGSGFRALDSMDCTIINCVTVNNNLVFSHATNALFNGTTIRPGIRNYRYFTPTDEINFESTFGSSSYYASFPATAATSTLSDTLVAYAMASPTDVPNSRFFGRLSGEPSWGNSVQFLSGSSFYDRDLSPNDDRNRWGDYFGACVDPWDDQTFWVHGMSSRGTTTWRTGLARVNRKVDTIVDLLNESAQFNNTSSLTATLRRTSDNAVLSNRSIRFYRGTVFLGSALTNNVGIATLNYAMGSLAVGSYTISAEYPDAQDYNGSEDAATLTVTKGATTVSISNQTTTYSGTTSLLAVLRRNSDNSTVSSRLLTFQLNGVTVGTDVTDGSGVASVQTQVLNAPPSTSYTVQFAGDSTYLADSASATLNINKANTSLQVSSGEGASGELVTFTAQLIRTTDNQPLAAQTVTFTFNGASLGSGTTNASGIVTILAAVPAGTPSQTITIGASYAGNTFYNARTASAGFTRWARRVIGTINLQNFVGNPNGYLANLDVVNFLGNVVSSMQASLKSDGSYKVYTNFASDGSFRLRAKTFHWLSQSQSINWSGSLPSSVSHSLMNGDVNGDNEVGPADFAALAFAFGTEIGDVGFSFAADLNGDGEVGPADFAILSLNFGQEGT